MDMLSLFWLFFMLSALQLVRREPLVECPPGWRSIGRRQG